MGGDGQVTLGSQVMKADAVKVRKLLDGQVLVGFAGSAADGFALLERFEGKLKDYPNNVPRAATELAKLWRTDRMLRRLEAVLVVVGLPTSLSGRASSAYADMARTWVERFRPLVAPVEVRLVDERLTTVSAAAALRASGRSAKRSRAVVDQAAAVALLQGVLDGPTGGR